MSWHPSIDPVLGDPHSCDALELVIVPRTRDLGDGFEGGRRALPHGKRQMVGPFIVSDHFRTGAIHVRQGHGRAARIRISGFATVTYLFGRQHHARDSQGKHPGNPAGAS